jgi:pantoate--beta-alanine ligase
MALKTAQGSLEKNSTDAGMLIKNAADFIRSHPETAIDYITICDPDTLEDVNEIHKPVLMALAVKVGATRLIDNMILHPNSTP